MLERLLTEIRKGGPVTPTILAGRLNVSVEMVKAMLEKLVQLRLIENFDPSCTTSTCHDCSLGNTCQKTPQTNIRLWSLK